MVPNYNSLLYYYRYRHSYIQLLKKRSPPFIIFACAPRPPPITAFKVGLPDMEKEFIRSLADIDESVEDLAPPLLQGTKRLKRYETIANPYRQHSGAPEKGSCGGFPGGKVVSRGHKKTLVLDLDETLVSSTRTPRPCDYKVGLFLIRF